MPRVSSSAIECANCGSQIPSERRLDAIYCSTTCGNNFRSRRAYNPALEAIRRSDLKRLSYEKKMLYAAKSRALKKGIEFSITADDIHIPSHCPVLGIEIDYMAGVPGKNAHSPSLDRIDNSKGYVRGNVCVVSSKANTIKRGYSVEELKAVVSYMERMSQ